MTACSHPQLCSSCVRVLNYGLKYSDRWLCQSNVCPLVEYHLDLGFLTEPLLLMPISKGSGPGPPTEPLNTHRSAHQFSMINSLHSPVLDISTIMTIHGTCIPQEQSHYFWKVISHHFTHCMFDLIYFCPAVRLWVEFFQCSCGNALVGTGSNYL